MTRVAVLFHETAKFSWIVTEKNPFSPNIFFCSLLWSSLSLLPSSDCLSSFFLSPVMFVITPFCHKPVNSLRLWMGGAVTYEDTVCINTNIWLRNTRRKKAFELLWSIIYSDFHRRTKHNKHNDKNIRKQYRYNTTTLDIMTEIKKVHYHIITHNTMFSMAVVISVYACTVFGGPCLTLQWDTQGSQFSRGR